MAEVKRHSGFEAPVYGTSEPKGTKIKKNPDGTITLIRPDEKKTGAAKKKTVKK